MIKKLCATAIAIFFLLTLFACSSTPNTPEDTAQYFAERVRKMDFSAAQKYSSDEMPPIPSNKKIKQMLSQICGSLGFEIVSSVDDGMNARVVVRTSTVDAQSVLNDVMMRINQIEDSSKLTSEELNDIIVEQVNQSLSGSNIPTTDSDIEMILNKDGESWKIQNSSTVLHTMTNGFSDFESTLGS